MAYYRNVREYLQALEAAGKLIRITQPINKDTELHPLVRLQFRGLPEEQRKAFLFENVHDVHGRNFDMPVAVACYAGTLDIYALGMQCRREEIFQKWTHAQSHPIEPVEIGSGPCQERLISGSELKERGLDLIPVPISTPGFDNGPYTTSSHFVTRDPENGQFNMGNYRGQIKAPDRIGCFAGNFAGLRMHWNKCRSRKQPLEVAVVIGVPPNVSYAATARIPLETNEYAVAGGISGESVELVRCKSVNLLVPAQSEIVIEGIMPTDQSEWEGPFGEFPGYMASEDLGFFVNVSCITMRKNPIYVSFLSQFPPSESSKIRGVAMEGVIRQRLLAAGLDNVLDVACHESSGSWGYLVVKIKKRSEEDFDKIIGALRLGADVGKVLVVVDEDIDARDADSVNWALSFRMQPHRDAKTVESRTMGLDPSVVPPEEWTGTRGALVKKSRSSVICIDATLPWPYKPTSLPKREFMEKALEIWNRLELPPLHLKSPWYGYELGHWSERNRAEAKLALEGKHFEIGERAAKERSAVQETD
ncbi:MAG: UbiD family decarboxylase [Deltaproteobacteria bacterium]|nr:UbiD family decarboxylase [Deltaproteobacteria bacterium]